MRPHYTPRLKKRTALMRERKEVFRRHRSQPIERVISLFNPMLQGRVNYFATGHPSECFGFIKRLSGEEGQAPYGGCSEATGLRLGAME
jgi:RNA-directed DNA polymerase